MTRSARQTIEDVFSEFAPEQYDYQFQKTKVLVKLLQPDYVSRSEARRLLANLEKFREIVLDFRDVRSVGQGFADRCSACLHTETPDIVVHPKMPVLAVMAMIRHVSREASTDSKAK